MQSSKNMKPYPSFLDLISELSAVGEFSRFASAAWTSRLVAPTQHPKALLLIPGFLAGDVTLYPFGDWLRSCGHRVFFPGMLANTGCPRLAVDRLLHLVREHHNRKGEKMVVIGHSLGGIYARELARREPQCVSQTILLAAPINDPCRHVNPLVKMFASLTRQVHQTSDGRVCQMESLCGVLSATPAPSVPEAIIFSKSDGVVDWVSCLESGPNVRCFEVDSTHCGLPFNLNTLKIVHSVLEDTLSCSEDGQAAREKYAASEFSSEESRKAGQAEGNTRTVTLARANMTTRAAGIGRGYAVERRNRTAKVGANLIKIANQ
jgi:hypothetical protein